jgi:2-polyprenyl-3-methyl-5-hydroxy-6-metoxy-1,4-benzoquinol methylase
MASDTEWQAWGEKDPYFGVLTDERYRRGRLTAESLEEFFRTGRSHIGEILAACRRHFGELSTRRSLDFGCGVGRLLIPLAEVSEVCVGVDIAGAMLQEAALNCVKYNRHNVRLARTLEGIDPGNGAGFSFIHSHMVLQHLDPQRGLSIISALLSRLDTGGVAALHMTYAHAKHRANQGVRPRASRVARFISRPVTRIRRQLTRGDPQMLMYPYDLNRVLFLAQDCGVRSGGLQFTDHAGHLGVILFLRRE